MRCKHTKIKEYKKIGKVELFRCECGAMFKFNESKVRFEKVPVEDS